MTVETPAPENTREKVKKLLRLGADNSGGTEAERDLAMQRAQEMMLKWNLDMASLSTEQGGDSRGEVEKGSGMKVNRRSQWQGHLLNVLATHNLCTAYFVGHQDKQKTKEWYVVGRPENIRFVMTLHQFLVEQLQREVKVALARDRADVPNPNAYRRAFFDGAIGRVHVRLADQLRMRSSGSGMELVRTEKAELDAFINDLFGDRLRKGRRAARPKNTAGRIAGDAAGRSADLFPGRKLGS